MSVFLDKFCIVYKNLEVFVIKFISDNILDLLVIMFSKFLDILNKVYVLDEILLNEYWDD